MKKYLQSKTFSFLTPTAVLLCAFFMLAAATLKTDTKADDVVGVWHTKENKGKVKIYRNSSNQYIGKIIWLKEPHEADGKPKVDKKNPDVSKRSQTVVGLFVLRDFVFKDNSWQNGKIYDPESGNDYSCTMKLKDPNTLEVRGYVGISLLGRTEVWKRTTE